MPVRIGIDFGTAYTKLAIRAADHVFLVPWDGVRNSNVRYFLPGEIAFARDGATSLGRMPGAAEVRSDLKLPFVAKTAPSSEQQVASVAFLAWVMRYARAWLYQNQAPLLRNRTIAWEVNLGCPTNSWSATSIRRVYEETAKQAWKLSQAADGVSYQAALALAGSRSLSCSEVGLDGLNLMPEFIAQIAGYVRSPQRRDGLHLLMDVGAGTVDIATFNVAYDDGREEDRYPIFASDVLPLGTHFLMQRRLSTPDGAHGAWDDLQAVPGAEDIARSRGISLASVQTLDDRFITTVSHAIERILSYTHARRYGKAPEWREGLPAFLSGGGAECTVYQRALSHAFARHPVKLMRMPFPVPDGIKQSPTEPFHRLSVAYGLTHDAESVGRILSPHEIRDAPRFDPVVDTPRERPDRDELYPK